jgi:hypothetical protein
MIKLPILVTKSQTIIDEKIVDTVVTDTLFISEVRIDFADSTIWARIQRGTIDGDGKFQENYSPLSVQCSTDGSFSSSGLFSGNPGDIPVQAIVGALAAQFDQFLQGILSIYVNQAAAAAGK